MDRGNKKFDWFSILGLWPGRKRLDEITIILRKKNLRFLLLVLIQGRVVISWFFVIIGKHNRGQIHNYCAWKSQSVNLINKLFLSF